tara:strand:- start:6520 stop:8037 length:1518 start_codon:yes stop_codon:yes gene_type:complete
MTKTALIILDGWGHGKKTPSNAIFNAKTPNIDKLYESSLNTELRTDGEHVGLPKGQMGNSEVGHLNLGAGRVVYQDLARINNDIKNNSFAKNKKLLEAIEKAKKKNKPIHIMGLLSDGGIHSHSSHLKEMCNIILDNGVRHIYIHAFTDGRDCDPKSGKNHVNDFLEYAKNKNVSIASLVGRYYAMDRDKRWERTASAYKMLTHGQGHKTNSIISSIETSYNNMITDEFIQPIIGVDENNKPIAQLKNNDIAICFNFRSDRCRQLVAALTQVNIPQYNIESLDIDLYTMTCYDETFTDINILYPKVNISNTIGEVISKHGLTQLRIAETEKYPHVTFFFSGGREKEFIGESRVLIPSPKVATYDLEPQMSAHKITESYVQKIKNKKPDFICLNYANPDMVGHTGDIQAVIKALETVDDCIDMIIKENTKLGYVTIILADHGNAEYMINKDGSPNTAHTTNNVPCFIINSKYKNISTGKLCDIAPTILNIMNLDIPDEMTGEMIVS